MTTRAATEVNTLDNYLNKQLTQSSYKLSLPSLVYVLLGKFVPTSTLTTHVQVG